jgi:serine protease AprX
VDDRVAMAAGLASPLTPIPVIVFGKSVGGRKNPEFTTKAALSGDAFAGTVTPAELDRLASDPNVAYIAPDTAMAPLAKPSSSAPEPVTFPDLKTQYPVIDGATPAWAQGYTGAGVTVGVIDSGTTTDEFDSGHVVAKSGYNRGDDLYGHGMLVSHVAAGCCAGGWYVGIAPGANVASYNANSGNGVYTSDVILGLLWAINNQTRYHIKVVNLSLGETTPSSAEQSLLDTIVEAMERSYGILVVVASGNAGPNSMEFAPANDPFALVVGATDTNGTLDTSDDVLAPWSSYGTTLDGYTKPDIVAPGRLIMSYLDPTSVLGTQAPAENWSSKHEYAAISGTSFAAPQVAGAAAILFEAHPTWTPGQVKWVLMNTARPVAGSTAGSLDLTAALAYQGTPPDANAGLTPSTFGDPDWVDSQLQGNQASWRGSSWSQASWNQASWRAQSWDQASWRANNWDQASWRQSSWNDNSWK